MNEWMNEWIAGQLFERNEWQGRKRVGELEKEGRTQSGVSKKEKQQRRLASERSVSDEDGRSTIGCKREKRETTTTSQVH